MDTSCTDALDDEYSFIWKVLKDDTSSLYVAFQDLRQYVTVVALFIWQVEAENGASAFVKPIGYNEGAAVVALLSVLPHATPIEHPAGEKLNFSSGPSSGCLA